MAFCFRVLKFPEVVWTDVWNEMSDKSFQSISNFCCSRRNYFVRADQLRSCAASTIDVLKHFRVVVSPPPSLFVCVLPLFNCLLRSSSFRRRSCSRKRPEQIHACDYSSACDVRWFRDVSWWVNVHALATCSCELLNGREHFHKCGPNRGVDNGLGDTE